MQIYYHFFNNSKVFSFNEECLFLHEEAAIFKYGKLGEYLFYMFKHEVENDKEYGAAEDNVESDDVRNVVNNVTEVIGEEPCTIVDIDDPDDMEH